MPPRPPRRERSQRRKWELWARMLSGNFAEMTTSTPFRDLLHARKSTTWDRRLYFPSEGRRAEDFSPLKIRRLWPGLNPRTWVLKANTLPLDHRSRLYTYIYMYSTNILPILIINRIYETQNLLSLQLVSVLVGLRTYQHPSI